MGETGVDTNGFPQEEQKALPSGLGFPHELQYMIEPPIER